jgi:hypothetical protein
MTTALELITKYTPFYPEAKPCFSGKYHIGYWLDNYEDGSPVKKGDTISEEKAKQVLQSHLNKIKLPEGNWNNNQKEALKSLIYYLYDAWSDSDIKKYIESGDFSQARIEWEKIRDGEIFENIKPWKQDEINLFFGEN